MPEQLTVTEPTFSDDLRAIQTTDPAHPDTWNPQYQALLENDHWLRDQIQQTNQSIEDILGSDPVEISDQLSALVQHGAQQVYTERREQVPSVAVTSAVAGDDSIDLVDTTGIEMGQHYYLIDGDRTQELRVKEVLSATRITLTSLVSNTAAAGATFSRVSPAGYLSPELTMAERGATVHVQGEAVQAFGWIENRWKLLAARADAWEVPANVTRLRLTGSLSRIAVISALPISIVRRPTNVSPSDGQPGLTTQPTLTGTDYYALYAVPQARREFQVIAADGTFDEPLYEASEIPSNGTPAVSHAMAVALDIESSYLWRYRDVTILGEAGQWSQSSGFTTASIYIASPTVASPANGATDIGETPTLTSSAFAVEPDTESDNHAASSWRIRDINGAITWESIEDTGNLTSIQVPPGVLQEGERSYTVEVRHHGQAYGDSAWSPGIGFTTAVRFAADIGDAGGQGFGVGVYPEDLPVGFTAMAGFDDPASDNYGNYQYQDGSVMVFVPAFYYRLGHPDSPRYGDYGANAVDVVSAGTYADRTTAAADGYALHRAFIDGGVIKSGFFYDKYLASQNGTSSCRSVKGGVPISLTTSTSYTRSDGMTGCTGILADAITLSRSRGSIFNAASIFQISAVALLSMAHAQAATGAANCAWYDSTGVMNFPKGCNSSLADVDDPSVTFTSAGDAGSADKPQAGSGSPFAKTTHNGQACGIADVNGSMWQLGLGITKPGSSATDTTAINDGSAYVLKESVELASLTAGHGGATDAWGTEASLANNYDAYADILPWGTATDTVYFGNGANQVFSEATDGLGWLRTACGLQKDTAAMSATGTNLFGSDYCYQYSRANMCVITAGRWSNAAGAGVFYRSWSNNRSNYGYSYGFRASAYGL
jgi:hypothetical protein